MPELVASPAQIPHQIEVVKFLAKMAITLRRVMAIERSFL